MTDVGPWDDYREPTAAPAAEEAGPWADFAAPPPPPAPADSAPADSSWSRAITGVPEEAWRTTEEAAGATWESLKGAFTPVEHPPEEGFWTGYGRELAATPGKAGQFFTGLMQAPAVPFAPFIGAGKSLLGRPLAQAIHKVGETIAPPQPGAPQQVTDLMGRPITRPQSAEDVYQQIREDVGGALQTVGGRPRAATEYIPPPMRKTVQDADATLRRFGYSNDDIAAAAPEARAQVAQTLRASYPEGPPPGVGPRAASPMLERPELGVRLLPPDYAPLPGRASLSAAAAEGPLSDISPQTIAKMKEVLQQEGFTPYTLEQRLEEMSAHEFLGELSPNTAALMSGLQSLPGAGRNEIVNSVVQRGREAIPRMKTVFDAAFGENVNTFEFQKLLELQQQKESQPFWDAFRATAIRPTPALTQLQPRLEAAGAWRAAERALRIEGIPLEQQFLYIPARGATPGQHVALSPQITSAGEQPTIRAPTAMFYQAAKEALDDGIANALAKGEEGRNQVRRLTMLKNDLVNAVDRHPDERVAGLWRQAREVYARPAALKKAEQLGERVLTGNIKVDDFPFLTAAMSDLELRAMHVGMRAHLEDRLGRPGRTENATINAVLAPNNEAKIRWAIGDRNADRLVAAIEHERRMHNAPNRLIYNSATAERLAGQQFWQPPELGDPLGRGIGFVRHPVREGIATGVEKVQALIGRRRREEFQKMRDEAARLFTLQGPERDAVLRYLVGGAETPPPGGVVTPRTPGPSGGAPSPAGGAQPMTRAQMEALPGVPLDRRTQALMEAIERKIDTTRPQAGAQTIYRVVPEGVAHETAFRPSGPGAGVHAFTDLNAAKEFQRIAGGKIVEAEIEGHKPKFVDDFMIELMGSPGAGRQPIGVFANAGNSELYPRGQQLFITDTNLIDPTKIRPLGQPMTRAQMEVLPGVPLDRRTQALMEAIGRKIDEGANRADVAKREDALSQGVTRSSAPEGLRASQAWLAEAVKQEMVAAANVMREAGDPPILSIADISEARPSAQAYAFETWLKGNGIRYGKDLGGDNSNYFRLDPKDPFEEKTIKIRFADHSQQSKLHDPADVNVAPGKQSFEHAMRAAMEFADEHYGRTGDGVSPAAPLTRAQMEALPGVPLERRTQALMGAIGRRIDESELKQWFGRSQIVDSEGNPLVVYYGAQKPIQGVPDPGRATGYVPQAMKGTSFFTSSREVASGYGPHIFAGHLKIENPFIYERKLTIEPVNRNTMWAVHEEDNAGHSGWAQNRDHETKESAERARLRLHERGIDRHDMARAIQYAKDKGHDGVIFRNIDDSIGGVGGKSDIYVTFDRDQSRPISSPAREPLRRNVTQYGRGEGRRRRIVEEEPLPIGQGVEQRILEAGYQRAVKPPFYSAVENAVAAAKQEKAPGGQWLGMLKNKPGVKPEEMQWVGLEDWLKQQKGPVTKQQVQDYIRANQIEVREVTHGGPPGERPRLASLSPGERERLTYFDAHSPQTPEEFSEYGDLVRKAGARSQAPETKFGSYQLPGGENYRELLLTLPWKAEKPAGTRFDEGKGGYIAVDAQGRDMTPGAWDTPDEAIRMSQESTAQSRRGNAFVGSHWDEPNVVAHIRFNDRFIPDELGESGRYHDQNGNVHILKRGHAWIEIGRTPDGHPIERGYHVLLIEEIQSDWHQKGRREGYRLPDAERAKLMEERKSLIERGRERMRGREPHEFVNMPETRTDQVRIAEIDKQLYESVPDAPFKTTWPELALKRMIRYAADTGYDKIAWTPGKVQAERYDLSKQVDSLQWRPDTGELIASKGGVPVIDSQVVPKEKLADTIGKEAAEKLLASEPTKIGKHVGGLWHTLEGDDLKVGGEGMLGFYDQLLPAAANKLTRKYGARVRTGEIGSVPEEARIVAYGTDANPSFRVAVGRGSRAQYFGPVFETVEEAQQWIAGEERKSVHVLDLPPALRRAALTTGFPRFAAGGRVNPAAIAKNPSQAQKEAGNYAKDHVSIHGLDIAIENAKGHERNGVDKNGKPWSVTMPAHYGYIKGTVGKDKDHVDVYLGPHTKSPHAFVVDQRDAATKAFDEHKAFLGFASKQQVVACYRKAFSDGRADERLGHIHEMSVGAFKRWLADGDTSKPIAQDAEKTKLPHAAVGYVTQSRMRSERCATCSMFIAPEHGGPSCTLVRNPISPAGWCRRWRAAKAEAA